MAGPEEMMDVTAGVKRPTTSSSMDLDSLQRKKFKTDELPLSAAQHSAIEHLLHAFKKRGGFDSIRKKIWSEFHDGVFILSLIAFLCRFILWVRVCCLLMRPGYIGRED